MKIEAKVYRVNSFSIKAMATLTIEDCFVVKGIKLIEGKNGLFMSMPNQKTANGEFKDICFPITKEARQQIIDEIMKQYNNIDIEQQNVQQEREAIQNEQNCNYDFGQLPF